MSDPQRLAAYGPERPVEAELFQDLRFDGRGWQTMPDYTRSTYPQRAPATSAQTPTARFEAQFPYPLSQVPLRERSPEQMNVDPPVTPPPNHARPPPRPASAFPFRMNEVPRRATPHPRHASARPNRGPPAALRMPTPQYPRPNPYATAPQYEFPQVLHAAHMAYAPPAAPVPHAAQAAAQHPAAPAPPAQAPDEAEEGAVTTPTPNGGWKEIQGKKPNWQFEKMHDGMASAWKDSGFPRCLVAMAGQGACDPGEGPRRDIEKETIAKIFGFTPRIIQAQSATTGSRRNDDPPCNLVQADQWEEIHLLLAEKCVSVRDGPTLFFFPIDPPLPSLMAVYSKPEAFAESGPHLAHTIRSRLFRPVNYDRITAVFQRELESPDAPNDVTPNDLAGILLNSITTKEVTRRWKGTDTPLVVIHCNVPTADEDTWFAIRNIFRTARLGTAITGQPVLYKEPMKCGTCRGVEHDTNMCYLHSLRNWYGPRANGRNDDGDDEIAAPRTRNDQRDQQGPTGRGRGGRGGQARRGGRR